MSEDDNVLQRLTRVETKLDILIEDKKDTAIALKTANEADISSRSAHKRIDEIIDNQKWLWRTVVGAILVGAVTAFIKFNGG